MTTTPRFKVGDWVCWLHGRNNPEGLVVKESAPSLAYEGAIACHVWFDPLECSPGGTVCLSDDALELA